MNLAISPVSIVIDVATGLVALTLLWSGIAKLKTSHLTLRAMRGLGIPALLQRSWVARLVPIVELTVGLVLLFAPGLVRFIGAVVATALFLAFSFYVTRAVLRGVEVACECFGSASHDPIDRFTVTRNFTLVVAGAIAISAGADSNSLVTSITPFALALLATVLLIAALGISAVAQHRHIKRLRAIINQNADHYRRESDDPLTGSRIPDAELVDVDGVTKRLAEIGKGRRAVLLIFSKAGCGDCARIARSLPDWERRLGDVVLPIIATSSSPGLLFTENPEFVGHTYFGASAARRALGIRTLPTAVLLAADGSSVATEVVEGSSAIADLVDALEAQLTQQSPGREPG